MLSSVWMKTVLECLGSNPGSPSDQLPADAEQAGSSSDVGGSTIATHVENPSYVPCSQLRSPLGTVVGIWVANH